MGFNTFNQRLALHGKAFKFNKILGFLPHLPSDQPNLQKNITCAKGFRICVISNTISSIKVNTVAVKIKDNYLATNWRTSEL